MHLHLKMSSENQSCSAFWCFMYTHLVNVDLWFHPSESKNKKNYFSEYIWSCVYHWYGLWGVVTFNDFSHRERKDDNYDDDYDDKFSDDEGNDSCRNIQYALNHHWNNSTLFIKCVRGEQRERNRKIKRKENLKKTKTKSPRKLNKRQQVVTSAASLKDLSAIFKSKNYSKMCIYTLSGPAHWYFKSKKALCER